jgi:hypothetical protein
MILRNLSVLVGLLPLAWVLDERIGLVATVPGSVGYLEWRLVDYREHGGENQIGAVILNLRTLGG